MATTTLGVKLDDATRDRLKQAAQSIDRTPHWLIKQAIFNYLEQIEGGLTPAERSGLAAAAGEEALESLTEQGLQVFLDFAESILPQSVLRAAITSAYRRPETEAVPMLLEQARLPKDLSDATQKLALSIAEKLRNQKSAGGRQGLVQGLLQEFSLSSQEGVALMCLAEALLRIPDKATRDALIRDKIANGNWSQHLGQSPSMFVNAASWGLLITGKLVSTHNEAGLSNSLNRLIGKSGEPVIRKGVDMAMRLMGEQFVTGETIGEALANATSLESKGFRYSYDMLGEAALTEEDAKRYLASYEQAIHAIGKASHGRGIYEGPGISIKLSALHPRYSRAQYDRVMEELYPILLSLTQLAKQYDIGINIDAEEADRLELSLDLLERMCFEPSLAGWNGIGFVIQAYQKRCPYAIDYVIDLAKRSRHRLMIRLVKGAYWDSEIKMAQVNGLEGYPVYTRKPYTDVSYIACARKLLAAPEAIYPQFATHNAHSLSAIYHLAGQNYYPGQYEFQCLHGMGEPLYEQVVGKVADGKLNRPCRIYAPVGSHETLLAYLVRRLLENGANTSFVNRIADNSISLKELVLDPVQQIEQMAAQEGTVGLPHPRIPLPRDLYGKARTNSAGLDLANEHRLGSLSSALLSTANQNYLAEPMLGCDSSNAGEVEPLRNPADHRDLVGHVREASIQDVDNALRCALSSGPIWQSTLPGERAAVLERAADLMEAELQQLMGLLVRESGKTFANAIAEVREAVDFLRYYAAQARSFGNDSHRPLGPVVCISPWNFPLAIFSGQVAAALAAGNTVLAKPAEQTPLIAAQAVRILLEAGVPAGAVQLLPGRGETVGARLVGDERVRGVMFTGSTEVAGILQRNIAGRLDAQGRSVPLIAETGGLNAMIVDSSALTEQVVMDVVASAFDSAGQRCSALRVLCVQDDVADRVLTMLKGAMAEYTVGNPERLNTDIGPVIDAEAKGNIETHIQKMRDKGRKVFQLARADGESIKRGTFVLPTLIELDSFDEMKREIFGPVLHVVRYARADLGSLLQQINDSGYGLTLGVHTRIDETIAQVVGTAKVGNLYVNRNIVGAVVGVQPFGGEGLSGTGPKAGGPLYLYRLLSTRPHDAVAQYLQHDDVQTLPVPAELDKARSAFSDWASRQEPAIAALFEQYRSLSQSYSSHTLTGPTGERNSYTLLPREHVLNLADERGDLLSQLAATLAVGSQAVWLESQRALYSELPKEVQKRIQLVADWSSDEVALDAILHHGDSDQLRAVGEQAAQRKGAIVAVHGLNKGETDIALERLLIEHALSVNTAAAGGNASLMTIG
ncbi:trifunctional transcriptional regulator/proline dehydrogenase/L-glutamate gamma-semialdehyde dehydrogenase [Pseudomonas berkeleyensis]|uniref:Bifunctional protein PutA n=1 Tax=Pseudomonas berkeleyensis TaxID=2726956 RepID=A0A7G5DSI0_9PSED|nr:trifunctional transcriptional regulator/proline dehydrogenase/L-glutamate gamma-semialdehyde dehydrogenase [Pseudomonas berkeleyensis]QMV64705.1 trifunctional transcriptional regulator/proline dehydrogenase/L-glutamate gamma-semialdehyde dehydrogenase [Pseudomonas berkeleyensis]WSO40173.1 trifunctional transcriptional regulator/proline dehydrogenase/L-glutamate gamma-semialdehyde dehydrogenase [Pseudomonas berkeleyensis]